MLRRRSSCLNRWILCVGVLTAAGACAPAPAAFDPLDPVAIAQIDSTLQAAMVGARAANAEQVLSSAVQGDEFSFVTGDVMLTGFDNVLATFRNTYSGIENQTQEVLESRIRLVAPDVAIWAAVGEGQYTDKAGFTSDPVGLGSSVVLVRRNGVWQVVHFHQSIAR